MSQVATVEDLEKLRTDLERAMAPAQVGDQVVRLQRWKRAFDQNAANGRSLMGPQFISDIELKDGSVVARTLEAQLVLSTQIIAGALSPADRVTMSAAGIEAYGTVVGTPNTLTFFVDNDGSFTFGVAPQAITFNAASGVLTVPAAVITSLTIADVGSGVFGGDYDSGIANPKIRINTGGIKAWNIGGTQTFFLDATTGNFDMIGTFQIASSTSASDRLQMTQTGIQLWKGGTREFYLQGGGATNAVTMLLTGPSVGQYIGMDPTNGLWLGASTFASGPFRVTPAGALTATSATITGAITATSGSLSNLSVPGTLTLSGTGLITTGTSPDQAAIEIDAGGFYQFNATGNLITFLGDTGSGFLGASPTYPTGVVSWTTAGALTIGGFGVTTDTLFSGTGGSFVTVSSTSTAFSAGSATPGSAPFRVSATGDLVATSATITGAITATSGSLGTLTVSGVLTLNSTGSFQTGGSDPRVVIEDNGIFAYNNLGAIVARINSDGTGQMGTSSGGKLAWNNTGVVTIAGFTSSVDTFSSGTGGSYVTMSSGATAFSAGSATPSSAPFRVTSTGALTATSATITGAITATSGSLGSLSVTGTLTLSGSGMFTTGGSGVTPRVEMNSSGIYAFGTGGLITARIENNGTGKLGSSGNAAFSWLADGTAHVAGFDVSTDTISSGTGGSYVTMSSGTVAFSAGGATPGSAPFNVTNAGAIQATSGFIGGWELDSVNGLKLGTLSNTRGISTGATAFYAGASTPSGAPFNVTTAGVMTALGATVTGTITANTGTLVNLGISGTLTMGTGAVLKSTSAAYGSTGIWLDYNAGNPRFSLGNKLVWDGSTLAITGAVTATSGSFTGAVTATSGSFTGSITASSLSITGTASFSGGTLTLPNGGSITSSTVNLNGNTSGNSNMDNFNVANLTVDGTITIGSGGKIVDSDGSEWNQLGIFLRAPGSTGDTIEWRYSGWASNRPYSSVTNFGSSTGALLGINASYGNGTTPNLFFGGASGEAYSTYAQGSLSASDGSGTTSIVAVHHTTPASSYVRATVESDILLDLVQTNRTAYFYGRIYPGTGSGNQTSRYISDANSRLTLTGQTELASHTVGGSAANWSTFGTANIPDKSAGYVLVYINGVACRIPFYGNG